MWEGRRAGEGRGGACRRRFRRGCGRHARAHNYDTPTHTTQHRVPTHAAQVDPKQLTFEQKVGEGEFGVVYRALYLGTPVAVKVLKDGDAVALGDFRTELNVLQKVGAPGNAV